MIGINLLFCINFEFKLDKKDILTKNTNNDFIIKNKGYSNIRTVQKNGESISSNKALFEINRH